jgi:hypothetical protein
LPSTCRRFQFKRAKLDLNDGEGLPSFDELLLALYTPAGVYFYRHDGQLGVSSVGLLTAVTGHDIKVYGPRGERDWSAALHESILPKLDTSDCEQLAIVTF